MSLINNLKNTPNPILSKCLKWLLPIFNEFGIILLILFYEFILIRIYEFIYLKIHFQINLSYFLFEFKGIYFDFLFVSILAIVSFIPFAIVYLISKKITRVIFYVINVIIVFITFILIDYLRHTFIPLDHAVFAYPVNELIYITKESVNIGLLQFARYLAAIVTCIYLTHFLFKRFDFKKSYIIGILFILSGLLLTKNLNPARRNYSNDTSFNLTINKLSFFAKSCANYFLGKSGINSMEFKAVANDFHKINNDIQFDNPNYPLEHKPDTADILGAYFNLNENPPNLVFIIMESLSSAFCGSNAYLGNFTPFLDSLITESLYWENYLSTSERTFNTIPSIFGSLPYGEKGFMQTVQRDYTVEHTTLVKWLSGNGYKSNFFYGGWTGFDNMERFFKYQNMDFILKHFGTNYSKIESDKNGFSWGYPDQSVYMRSFEILDSLQQSPRLDIYMTLSLHHPFRPPNREYYIQKFEERMNELIFSDKKKKETRIYSDIFATILYTDDAIKYLINEYKNRDEFENTVFVITGDHRLGTQNIKNNLDRYHVPLIIYSPMLKDAVKFSSVSSHANISPTLYPFLAKNFNFELPEKVHWLAKQLDTSVNFRNIHILPIMKINREISDYLSHEYFLSDNVLHKLNKSLELELINNSELLDSLKRNLNNFVVLNQYITKNNLIISFE